MWSEIRGAGFGEKVKNRDLRRLWTRRHDIRKKVELLELGRAGGFTGGPRGLLGR